MSHETGGAHFVLKNDSWFLWNSHLTGYSVFNVATLLFHPQLTHIYCLPITVLQTHSKLLEIKIVSQSIIIMIVNLYGTGISQFTHLKLYKWTAFHEFFFLYQQQCRCQISYEFWRIPFLSLSKPEISEFLLKSTVGKTATGAPSLGVPQP